MLELKWKTPNIEPEVHNLVSSTVLFLIDHKVYMGHYHCNGFFYCDEYEYKDIVAVCNSDVYKQYPYAKEVPIIEAWAYLREDSYVFVKTTG